MSEAEKQAVVSPSEKNPEFFKDMNPQQREFFELMMKEEELHPDLKPWLVNTKGLGRMLKHPLVFEHMFDLKRCARINKAYLYKKEAVEKAIAEKDFNRAIWWYERPYRMQTFIELMDEMSHEEYWDILGSIWTDSENLWQYNSFLGMLLHSKRPGREHMMDEEERTFLSALPDEFSIYRGHQGKRNRNGWSWSLSYGKAKWFGFRFSQKGAAVARATVKKSDVIAYLDGRNEFEIVVDPACLEISPVKPVKRRPFFTSLLEQAWEGFALRHPSTAHGRDHWEKVEFNALALAKATPGCDAVVAQLFAILHDSKRVNEDDDPKHGHRAAKYVQELYKKGDLNFLNESQLSKLQHACHLHNDGKVSDDPTIGVCWDADRLDLTRVGIMPDDKYLSTKAGKEMKWKL